MGLDRIGTFRCKALDWGVDGKKKKGTDITLPWFNVRVLLTQFYDPKEGEWFDYTEDENNEPRNAEITAFQCLYGAIKAKGGEIGPTLSMDQVKKVFTWDGRSLAKLAGGDYSELEFQIRIGDNTYEAATSPYQVDWIDVYDANPSGLRKLDAKELKDLDKQFAALGAKGATTKPAATAAKAPAKAKAKVKPHPARVPADDGTPDSPEEKARKVQARSAKNMAKAEAEAEAKAKAEAKTGGPPPPPVSQDAVVPPAPVEKTECTMNEAWVKIVELRDPTISDETIGKVWHSSIAEIAGPDVKSEDVTPTQWYQVGELTLDSVAKL